MTARDLRADAGQVWDAYNKGRFGVRLDDPKTRLVMDWRSYYYFLRVAHREVYPGRSGGLEWRDIPLKQTRVRDPLEERYIGDDTMVSAEVIEEPFCMYIIAQKTNGRVLYFDHPDTDKRFL